MASGSKCLKSCSQKNEDRISGLPDALLCHILSCFSTREAVRTSVLSHRWKNVWADVPNLYLDENEFGDDTDKFERFVNGVLLHRSPVDIKRFCLVTSMMRDVPLLYTWFSIAIRRNVVELDLTIGRDYATDKRPFFELPKGFLRCSTLVRLTLWLRTNIDVQPTKSNRFPCLKFLHVTVAYPDSDSMKNLFTRFPVLEDLIIDGILEDTAAFKLKISAPKLKRLQNKLDVAQLALIFPMFAPRNFKNYKCKIFMNVDAPNLEELDMCFDVLLSFSLKNAKRLCKVKIDFLNVEQLKNHDRYLGLADRICQTFAGICDAKYLTVGAPISAVLGIGYQRLLPTFNSLNHLELLLRRCRDLQSLVTLLKMSPNLEHLKISVTKHEYPKDSKYCDEDNGDVVLHEWDAPEFAHICLISHLKTVCLWDFKGCPNDMEVVKYLVKNGKSLNKVTIHTRSGENKDMESQSPTALMSQFSDFPWGSKTCEIEYRTIV